MSPGRTWQAMSWYCSPHDKKHTNREACLNNLMKGATKSGIIAASVGGWADQQEVLCWGARVISRPTFIIRWPAARHFRQSVCLLSHVCCCWGWHRVCHNNLSRTSHTCTCITADHFYWLLAMLHYFILTSSHHIEQRPLTAYGGHHLISYMTLTEENNLVVFHIMFNIERTWLIILETRTRGGAALPSPGGSYSVKGAYLSAGMGCNLLD